MQVVVVNMSIFYIFFRFNLHRNVTGLIFHLHFQFYLFFQLYIELSQKYSYSIRKYYQNEFIFIDIMSNNEITRMPERERIKLVSNS